MKGVAAKNLHSGVRYVAVHYSADEEKGPDWVAQKKIGVPQNEWEREMELNEKVWEGDPVFPEYVDAWHCPKRYHVDGIPLVEGAMYFGGTDAGTTLRPAFVLLQVTPPPYFQVHAILEVTSLGSEPMSAFAPRILAALRAKLPGAWTDVTHGADETIWTSNGATGISSGAVAAGIGLDLGRCSNVLLPRIGVVTKALMQEIEGVKPEDPPSPGFLVDAIGCPMLRDALLGGYKQRARKGGVQSGPEAVWMQPLKNMYADVADALQYAMLMASEHTEGWGAKMLD